MTLNEKNYTENYNDTILRCKNSGYTGERYTELLISKSFENGISFANSWIQSKDKTPLAYQTGGWDGKRSDFVLAKTSYGDILIARVYEGFLDGNNFLDWYDSNDVECTNIQYWRFIELNC